jgi:predicted dehydrogenase
MPRIGFIGCGGWARKSHIERMAGFDEVGIVGFADPQTAAIQLAREVAPSLGQVPGFADYREMLSNLAPDAVVISTPHALHERHILDSFAAGAHVMCEKPFVHDLAAARRVISARDQSGRMLMIPYQRNFQPEYMFAVDQIAGGRLGDVQMITAWQSQGWARNVRGTWRAEPGLSSGGQLMDSGSHLLDFILRAVRSRPTHVSAALSDLDMRVNVNSALTVRFEGGALANIAVIGNAPSAMWEEIGFYGSKARLLMRSTARVPLSQGMEIDYESVENEKLPVDLEEGSLPDRNFVDALCGRDRVRAGAEAARSVLALTEAVWRSAESGCEERVES